MLETDAFGLFAGAVALGAVHGIEPGHGWPVAASYALDQTNAWLSGLAASLLLGTGHLVSSIAMVLVFFYAKAHFELTQVDRPIAVFGVGIGGPVSVVAGVVLIALGVREYRGGHSHGHGVGSGDGGGDDHDHSHGDAHDHDHSRQQSDGHSHDGVLARVRGFLPFVGGYSHEHGHGSIDEATERGLLGIAWFAFLLGFAHEEEFEIIALCAGSTRCLELMTAYALTVILGIVVLTMALIAGYSRFEERVERYASYLPVVSAAVLMIMGLGFVLGLF
jgi:ABC-type nickel/cobalt efflux system permease component RcnA